VSAGTGRVEKVSGFVGGIMEAFEKAAPTVGGPFVRKALVPSGAVAANFTGRIVNDPKASFDVLSAVTTEEVQAPSGTYLRQSVRTNNAAPVVSGNLKPISTFELVPAVWEVATIAHLTNPIQSQWLADYAGLQTFLSQELAYGLNAAMADFVLNGGQSENGNAQTGILNTAGVSTVAFATNKLLTIRKALGQLEAAGVTATGILMNPADWEAVETLTDTAGRFLLPQTPGQNAARTLWNTPVTLSSGVPANTAVVGDLRTVVVPFRSGMQLTWSEETVNTGTQASPVWNDSFRKNQLVFRAEVRMGISVLSAPSLRKATLA